MLLMKLKPELQTEQIIRKIQKIIQVSKYEIRNSHEFP